MTIAAGFVVHTPSGKANAYPVAVGTSRPLALICVLVSPVRTPKLITEPQVTRPAHADGGCREVIDKMQDSVQKSYQIVAPKHGVRYIGRLAC